MSSSVPSCGHCQAMTKTDGTPLLRCPECKTQAYCSKESQTKHWNQHQTDSLTCKKSKKTKGKAAPSIPSVLSGLPIASDGTIYMTYGMVIAPATLRSPPEARGKLGYICASAHPAKPEAMGKVTWTDIAVSHKLGLPLRMVGVGAGMVNSLHSLTPADVLLYNGMAASLTMEPEPESAMFGQLRGWPSPTGPTLITRIDGKPLHSTLGSAFIHYVESTVSELGNIKERVAKGKSVDKHELAKRSLYPGAFAKALEVEKQTFQPQYAEAWEGVHWPEDA